MSKQDNCIKFDGTVLSEDGNSFFTVKLDNDMDIKCTIAGKLRMFNIRIIVGDRVCVAISPYDVTNGRIEYRYRPGESSIVGKKAAIKDNNRTKKKKR